MSNIYLLGLTSQQSPRLIIDERRIEFIKIGNLFAVIERRAAPPIVSEQELRAQHDVVTTIFSRIQDLLPARFGAWMDGQELTDTVARQKEQIVDALDFVRGRVQMTMRFLGAAAVPPRELARYRETGTEYLMARRDADRSIAREATALRAAVRELVIAERVDRGSSRIPASMYHLIARDAVAAYAAAARPFQSESISLTGPWPPFAFAPDPWS
jgi:hypothetical protein